MPASLEDVMREKQRIMETPLEETESTRRSWRCCIAA